MWNNENEELENLRGLKSEIKEAKTEQEIYNLCEEYEYEIDVDYTNCSLEEIKKDLITSINWKIKDTKEEIDRVGENIYYSNLYGIPYR